MFVQEVADKPFDIWALTREGTTWRATPVVRSRFSDIEPALSPDGRWLAYVSDESGQPQVYVQPFPGPGRRHQISTNGGREPLWARDGRTLYYLAPTAPAGDDQMVTAVPVASGTRFTAGKPKPLFQTRYGGTTPVRGYDIAKDGRFLMVLNEPVTIDCGDASRHHPELVDGPAPESPFEDTTLGCPSRNLDLQIARRCCLRNRPVYDALHAAMTSGVPATTTVPPACPPSGPRSMT